MPKLHLRGATLFSRGDAYPAHNALLVLVMLLISSPSNVRKFCRNAFAEWPSLGQLDALLGAAVDQEVTNVPSNIAVIRPIDPINVEIIQFGPFIVKRSHELILDIWGEPEWKVVFKERFIQNLCFNVNYNPVILRYESVEATLIARSLFLVRFELQQLK